ncbi:PTS transporter subunit EIIC [[Mycoplasma] imitans]|uniref:PTS transporter subunit EIIC n=1 Tax=[Mycoplasma] imitans TaxID=29560 RepID=UPI0006852F8A|nr:PTS transporter subunit EIIC [[Mycoplasma] imitans]
MSNFKYKFVEYLKAHGWIYQKKSDDSQRVFKKHSDSGIRQKIQKFGSFMGGMIMPTIGVFIAWGLWASAFLYNSPNSHGWFQAPELGKLVPIGIKWLLPLLIAINAGKMIYGIRGAAISALLTTIIIVGTTTIWNQYGAGEIVYEFNANNYKFYNGQELIKGINDKQYFIVDTNGFRVMGTTTYNEIIQRNVFNGFAGRDPNQIIGAMIVGPLGTKIFKTIEENYIDSVRPGFEMLIRNFSLAIIAILMGLVLFYVWPWIMYGVTILITMIINSFGQSRYVYPILTIFTEPLRTIFLNNALNYGVMSPLGLNDISQQQLNGVAHPHSIYFLYAGNGGPGLGLLLSFVFWKKGAERANAAGASVVQFVGGIHEVYYVYVVQRPIFIISTILGAAASMTVFSFADGGTSTIVSPGSIISVVSTSPTSKLLGINIAGVLTGTVVTFSAASVIHWLQKKNQKGVVATQEIIFSDSGMTFKSKQPNVNTKPFSWANVKNLVVACDAGMGSSAMAAGIIRKWVKENNVNDNVTNCALKDLPADADVIVTTNVFEQFAKDKVPNAFVYSVTKFLDKGIYDQLYKNLKDQPITQIEVGSSEQTKVKKQAQLENKTANWFKSVDSLSRTLKWIFVLILFAAIVLFIDAALFDQKIMLYNTTINYVPDPINGANTSTTTTTTSVVSSVFNYLFIQIALTIFMVIFIGFSVWLNYQLWVGNKYADKITNKTTKHLKTLISLLLVIGFGLMIATLVKGVYLNAGRTIDLYLLLGLNLALFMIIVILARQYTRIVKKNINTYLETLNKINDDQEQAIPTQPSDQSLNNNSNVETKKGV